MHEGEDGGTCCRCLFGARNHPHPCPLPEYRERERRTPARDRSGTGVICRIVNEQVRHARGVHGAGGANCGSYGTARSYTFRAPCTAQKLSRCGAFTAEKSEGLASGRHGLETLETRGTGEEHRPAAGFCAESGSSEVIRGSIECFLVTGWETRGTNGLFRRQMRHFWNAHRKRDAAR
jgi:hypothetical protein